MIKLLATTISTGNNVTFNRGNIFYGRTRYIVLSKLTKLRAAVGYPNTVRNKGIHVVPLNNNRELAGDTNRAA